MFWVLAFAILTIIFYYCFIKPFTYWSRLGVPQQSIFNQWINQVRFLLRTYPQFEMLDELYKEFPDKRYIGIYQAFRPLLLVRDPELIKLITVKDFDHFVDHIPFLTEYVDPVFGKTMFGLKGDNWRETRTTISPAFTSSKLRGIFTLINECSQQLLAFLSKNQTIDVKDTFQRFSNDVIAITAFGINCNSFENPRNEFYLMGEKATTMRGLRKNFGLLCMLVVPTLARKLGITRIPLEVKEFFSEVVKNNIEQREKHGIVRPDMVHLLLEARKAIESSDKGKTTQNLSDDHIVAQVVSFFLAGFDGISNLMCFLMYELAVNPDIQKKLREEVDNTLKKCNDVLLYESLLEMKYLDLVVSEALRKWPIAVALDRVCVKPYTIQPSLPSELPLHIKKNTILWLPIYPIQRNSEFYPNPERFDPERFNEENKHKAIPYTYFPFGVGPRACIATRYSLLEAKTVLFHIVSRFEIVVSEKTDVPFKLARDQFSLSPDSSLWLQFKQRK